jgi:hypothetical protein
MSVIVGDIDVVEMEKNCFSFPTYKTLQMKTKKSI